MKRALAILATTGLAVVLLPASASADGTYFFGYSPTPAGRPARGFAIGLNMVIVGFEFEYSATEERTLPQAPGLKTFMMNGLLISPTSGAQVYVTAGAGFFRETVAAASETSFGTNIGGGAKIRLAGPLRLRVDYRIFSLRGSPISKAPQRFYVGANVAF